MLLFTNEGEGCLGLNDSNAIAIDQQNQLLITLTLWINTYGALLSDTVL
jgi:hypothetical protein